MAAVIRLKRHLCEEPLEALVVNCKRQKRNEDDEIKEEETKTVLKFAGTIKEQNEDFTSHISKISKSELEQSYKKRIPEVNKKSRQDFKDSSKNNRFKIVNLSRTISNDKDSPANKADEEKLAVTVLDIESEDPKDKEKSSENNFVYDLYYTNSDDFGDCLEDEEAEKYLRVLPAGEELVFEDDRDGYYDDDELSSEDSNAENNWRNDYPDEESVDSVDDSDIINAVNNLHFEDDLSSDDGEEGFMYSIDSEAAGFEEDLDQSDVRRYGEMYARFKARQKKEEEMYNKDMYDDEIDDEDYYD